MNPDELKLKSLIEQWQEALRRYNCLQAMREALPSGPAAPELDKLLAGAKQELDRLQKAVLDEGGQ